MLRRHLAAVTVETTVEWLAVVGALGTIPLTIFEWSQESPLTDALDVLIWVVFVAEAWFLWRRARRDRRGWAWVWLSVGVCVLSCPLWLFVFRQFADLSQLVRLLRILRLVRLGGVGVIGFPALRRIVRPGLIYISGLTALLVVIAAGIFTLSEPAPIGGNYMAGLWLAVVTAATVGYGDLAPRSAIGRVTAVALMVAGIGLLSTLSASIAAAFVGQEDSAEEHKTRQRIERIEQLLEARGEAAEADIDARIARLERMIEALSDHHGIERPAASPGGNGAAEPEAAPGATHPR